MASIHKTATGYIVIWRISDPKRPGKQKQTSKRFRKKDPAEYFKRELENNQTWAKAGNPNIEFKKWWKEYLDFRFMDKPAYLIKKEMRFANQLEEFFKSKQVRYLDDITPQMVNDFVVKKSKVDGNRPQSVNRLLYFLKPALSYAAKTYHKKYRDLYESIEPLKVKEKRKPKILGEASLELFMDACSPRQKLYFGLLLYTGMRPIELEALKWEKIDLQEDIITVEGRTKNSEWREIPIHGNLMKLLEAMEDKTGYVVKPDQNYRRTFRSIIKKAGLPKEVTPYSLRHSFATAMLKSSGGNLRLVQVLLGHSDIRTTTIYTRIMNDLAKEEVKKLKF